MSHPHILHAPPTGLNHFLYARGLSAKADRLFLVLGALQATASLVLALWLGQWLPFLAVVLPGLVVMAVQSRLHPGTRISSSTTALVLMAMVAATIQQSHGLIETHFGVFVVIALLLYYRDWLPVVVAAAAIAVHHLAFYWMQTRGLPVRAFLPGSGPGIVLLHALYVVVETGFVCVMAVQLRQQLVSLGHGPRRLAELARGVARGEPVPEEIARMHLPAGSLATALVEMSTRILDDARRERQANEHNARTRVALDASRTGMMIADEQHIIRYANRSVLALLRNQQAELRKQFPEFDADHIVGTSIHQFHADPERIRHLLDALDGSHEGRIQVGNAHFSQTVTPVRGEQGQSLGFVVEWHDRTEELKLEREIFRIVEAAGAGDLGQRLPAEGSSDFFTALASGINRFLDTTQDSVREVRSLLSALSDGILDRRIEREFGGDFGQMKTDANTTADRLARIIGQLQHASARIDAAAGEIATGNQDLSRRSEQQAANLQETAATMEEMTVTVRQNADHARQANELVQGAADVASHGEQVVQQAVTTMGEVETASHRIAEIIGIIDGIAFQTNILALNAAVEAARAGDQGRGFAVVAGEVRALAQRSASAAHEIKSLIEDSMNKVGAGSELVRQSGRTMSEIMASVQRVAGIMGQITIASQEQAAGIEQVGHTVAQMDQATQQNAALVEEATAAARALEEEAADLARTTAMFRLQTDAPAANAPSAAPVQHRA